MGYGRNVDRRKISFVELTVLGWNPSKSHLVLENNPADKFDFVQPEPISGVKI